MEKLCAARCHIEATSSPLRGSTISSLAARFTITSSLISPLHRFTQTLAPLLAHTTNYLDRLLSLIIQTRLMLPQRRFWD